MELRICIDVNAMERAVAFYTDALELLMGRRLDSDFVEILGTSSPIDLLLTTAGTQPLAGSTRARSLPAPLDAATVTLAAIKHIAESDRQSIAGCLFGYQVSEPPAEKKGALPEQDSFSKISRRFTWAAGIWPDRPVCPGGGFQSAA